MQISLIIMTLNAEKSLAIQLDRILSQTVLPHELIVVDSMSNDGTADIVRRYSERERRIRLIEIQRAEFDHGGSRDLAYQQSSGEFVLFMTQDALPVDCHYIENILKPLKSDNVAAVCGRQVAYPDAKPAERLVRMFNYPPESKVWDARDIPRLGVKSYFISDVCSAYRREAYEAVGGFDCPILTSEDMMIAAKFIHAGYSLAYCAEAAVYHSHGLTLKQQYARNLAIGKVMAENRDRLCGANSSREGIRLLEFVLKGLFRQGKVVDSFRFILDCTARYLGNLAGKRCAANEKQVRGSAME